MLKMRPSWRTSRCSSHGVASELVRRRLGPAAIGQHRRVLAAATCRAAKTSKRPTAWPKASFADLDETAIDMTQALLPAPDATTINVLRARRLSPSCRFAVFDVRSRAISASGPQPCDLQFVPYETARAWPADATCRANLRRHARLHGTQRRARHRRRHQWLSSAPACFGRRIG